MEHTYLVKEDNNRYYFSPLQVFKDPSKIKLVNHPIKIKILQLLSDEALYAVQIAKKMNMHEQKIYYHLNQLVDSGVLEIVERKEIRGTTAKKYVPKTMNFAFSLGSNWEDINQLIKPKIDSRMESFFHPFIKDRCFNAKIVVGSPDPHGPFKARARDSHYAIDLSLFFGQYCRLPKEFIVNLDVDVKIEECKSNLIIVGGPVTNLLGSRINEYLPVKFSDKKPWGIMSPKSDNKYVDDSIGLIAKIDHPFFDRYKILYLAGVRVVGTKAAVLAITRDNKELIRNYNDQKEWIRVVQGYDMDGDGRIDTVEILE